MLENWKAIQNEILNLSDDKIFFDFLDVDTKTISLFDKFYSQEKPYLALSFMNFSNGPIIYSTVSLLLIKNWKAIRRNRSNLTISKLKKSICSTHVRKYGWCSDFDDNELASLFQQINGLPKEEFIEFTTKNKRFPKQYYPLSQPISLRAQISENREGYGNIYCGKNLIREGTKYGETTEFLIVGIRVGTSSISPWQP